jgi:PAS domain S-box-containing protein
MADPVPVIPSPGLRRLKALAEGLVGPELYIRIVEALPDALVIVNSDGEMVLANAQAELLLGYHRSELIGKEVEILIPEQLRERHQSHRMRFMSDPRVRPMGIELKLAARHKDGHELPVEINLSPLVAPEGVFVLAVLRPIRLNKHPTDVAVGAHGRE